MLKKNIKSMQLITFLLIVFPGEHVFFFNFLYIPLIGILNNFVEMLNFDSNFILDLIRFLFYVFLIFFTIKMFNKNKIWSFGAMFLQYLHLIICFKINYLTQWIYILPISVFIGLSFYLLFQLITQNNKE